MLKSPNSDRIRVEVIRAWPRRHDSCIVELHPTATVEEAIIAAGMNEGGHVATAVHGELVEPQNLLMNGDRVELLRALTIDPKEARRKRAKKKPTQRGES